MAVALLEATVEATTSLAKPLMGIGREETRPQLRLEEEM